MEMCDETVDLWGHAAREGGVCLSPVEDARGASKHRGKYQKRSVPVSGLLVSVRSRMRSMLVSSFDGQGPGRAVRFNGAGISANRADIDFWLWDGGVYIIAPSSELFCRRAGEGRNCRIR